jgi:hypothetical protein
MIDQREQDQCFLLLEGQKKIDYSAKQKQELPEGVSRLGEVFPRLFQGWEQKWQMMYI